MIKDGMWFECAEVTASLPPLEMYNGEAGLATYVEHNHISSETAKTVYKTMVKAPEWLPFAAEVYETSKNIKDYFLVPTIIMPSDLPNRNGAAFPLGELTAFSEDIGDLAYRGWRGKPVHVEHQNTNPKIAIGAVADVSMRPLKNTSLWKVITLLAIDRTKRPDITGEILAGRRNNYSMGAMVKGHVCSICGCKSTILPTHRTKFDGLTCKETHASLSRNYAFRTFQMEDGKTKMGYLNVHGIKPIEVSSVGVPAYASAETTLDSIKEF